MAEDPVLEWLLEEDQPSVRYRTLTELLGRRASDPEVRKARRRIPTVGWAAELLAERGAWGGWGDEAQLYTPKKLDDPQKLKVFSDMALDALKNVPEDKAKVLTEKIKTGMTKKK